jgi:hypothetical protein
MRPLLAPLALLFCVCAARASDVTFKRVWPEWHDADSFQSLHEDRTGRELTGGWIVLRSQPEKRGGLYFLTRVENHGAQVAGATFIIRLITLESTETKTYSFPAIVPNGQRLFELGLTGSDWKGPRVQPVAWELELDAADGTVLARMTSYLWEKPEH